MGPSTFQSSFIPKGIGSGMASSQGFQKKKTSLFGLFSVLVALLVLLLTVGLFVYGYITRKSIESLKTELALAEETIDTKTIDNMDSFSRKLSVARGIVMKHRVLSNSLALLEGNTIQSVFFNDFSYEIDPNSQLSITLSGQALDYGSIALQESVFSEIAEIKSMEFSDFSLIEGGNISFKLSIIVDPSSAIYAPLETEESIDDL